MIIFYLLIFITGCSFGSFINVLALNYKTKKTLLIRSKCPKCHTQLKWYDLIPLLSFLKLKGKCRYCHQNINIRYFIVELLIGIISILIFHHFKFTIETIIYLLAAYILIYALLVDIQLMIIPDRTHILIILLSIILILINPNTLIDKIIGSLIISLPLLLISLLTNSIGLGDVKLLFCNGLLIGTNKIILTMITSSLSALIYCLVKHKYEIPFAPFIAINIIIAILYGDNIINLYLKLL